jgi:hypothetical protein
MHIDNNPQQPLDDAPPQTPSSQEPSPLWIFAFGGLLLVLIGGFVTYETLGLFASGSAEWLDCIRTDGVALSGCSDQLDFAFEYRYGLDGLSALASALILIAAGPVPMIVMLRRYDNNVAGMLMFLLVMFPYGLLFFLLMVLATFVMIFYGVELT